jgi:hypothetical protein
MYNLHCKPKWRILDLVLEEDMAVNFLAKSKKYFYAHSNEIINQRPKIQENIVEIKDNLKKQSCSSKRSKAKILLK